MRFTALVSLAVLSACTSPEEPPGRETFVSYCAGCHGMSGQGDGPLAQDLPVAPADLTRLTARNGGTFPTSAVMAKIYGYPGRYQAHVMPEFGPVLEGRTRLWEDENGTLIETPQALLDLAGYLRGLQVE